MNGRQTNEFGLIIPPEKGCVEIVVSKDSLRRAIRIMDTIIKALEKLGYSVYPSGGSTKTKIQGAAISFRISEKLTLKKKRQEDHDLDGPYKFGHSRLMEDREPSGNLSLTVHDVEGFYVYGCRQNWNDGEKTKLENRISDFIDGLEEVAVAKIEHERHIRTA